MPSRKPKPASPSDAVDEQLARYRAMRDFAVTAEPSGSGKQAASQLPFVVQKHAATRLHYDFRLGWHGVLKSWAVTKGPSYYPGDKRLAVEVEDHPMEYGGFEGTIPKGQYGGGTVMVWDHGTWEPHGDVDEGLRTGRLKFGLNGEKLKGNWTLVRMGGHAARESKPNWLLIKEHDEFERSADDVPITEEAPNSVVTKRDLDAIANSEDHVWNSKPSAPARNRSRLAQKLARHKQGRPETASSPALEAAPTGTFPGFVKPQLATSVSTPPAGDGWIHELKLDGYRVQMHVREQRGKRKATLYTRNGLDWTARMPDLARAAERLPVKAALLDGEVVVLNESGGTSFADLQAAFEDGARHRLTYFAFDLLHLDGHNTRELPLIQRKEILEGLVRGSGDGDILRYSEHVAASAGETFQKACDLGAEGIVSKLATAKYVSGRSKSWLKLKCIHEQEFVIGGFTLPSNKGQGIGSLLLGYYQDGKLSYAGRTGTGFTQHTHAMLREKLDSLRQPKPAFHTLKADAKKDAIWVKPELVAEVRFATWTADHRLRQASFQGLREDKAPKEVAREDAVPAPKPAKAARKKSAAQEPETVGGLRITHPDKVLDVETGLTKQQLADYYAAVAENMLPHVADRPLSLVRCPEGSGKPCFFQKHVGVGLPRGVGGIFVPNTKGGPPEQYVTISTAEGLVGLAQMGVLEIHPWGSRNESLERPDRLIFDLDPDAAIEWTTLVESAFEVRDLLKQIGLESFVKSTGGKGLHVVAPIRPDYEWPEIKTFAHGLVLALEEAKPKLYLTKMTKAARKDRIYLDYLRNGREATAVAPYSPRARKGARVALPFSWKELRGSNPPQFAVANFKEWKPRLRRDPWASMGKVEQAIDKNIMDTMAEAQGKRR